MFIMDGLYDCPTLSVFDSILAIDLGFYDSFFGTAFSGFFCITIRHSSTKSDGWRLRHARSCTFATLRRLTNDMTSTTSTFIASHLDYWRATVDTLEKHAICLGSRSALSHCSSSFPLCYRKVHRDIAIPPDGKKSLLLLRARGLQRYKSKQKLGTVHMVNGHCVKRKLTSKMEVGMSFFYSSFTSILRQRVKRR